ncbi:MAG: GEVED domain-containing protein, partial [Flavobacteriales bacterium]
AVPCPGSTALLNAGVVGGGLPYASYAWTVDSGNATLSSASAAAPSATVNADATFSITLTDACGLTASGTTSVYDVTENPLAVTPVNPTVCGNPGTTFTATGGADYTWTPNDVTAQLNTSTGAVVIASPTSTKTYTVTGTYGAGCIGTATTTLNYTAPPAITITNEGPDQDINCGYGPVYQSTLHATSTATYTYTWSNGSGNNAADVFTPGANGFLDAADDSSFVVTLTAEEVGGAGCYSVSQRAVSVFPLPTPTMTATPAVIQLGATSVLASGVTQGNFSVSPCPPSAGSIGYNRITPPVTATVLVSGGVASTPLTSGSLDDGGWSTVPLGFTYNFFGNNYTSLNVGTNGVVQFGAYNAANLGDFTYANPFPTTLEPTNIIALCAVDLYLVTSGSIRYWVDGVAPNRKFVLDFFQVPGFTTNGLQTVQLQLSETTGIFEIHLGQATSTSAKTIGVNNATGTIGAVAPRCEGGTWNSQTGTSTIQRAWKFSPPVDYTFAWSPSGQISGAANLGSATALPTASGVIGYELLITDNVSACSNAANPDSVYLTVLPVPTAPVAVGYGELSLVDGAGTVGFCGEQDIEAYVPAGSYPATVLGQSLTYTARWYLQATGGTPAVSTALGDTIVYGFLNNPAGLTADDTIWVSVYNGYGESTRSQLVLDFQTPPAISISNSSPLNCGPSSITYTSTLVASSSNPTPYSYAWSPAGILDVTSGNTVVASFNNSVTVTLNADDGYCYDRIVTPISRYDFPAVTPTAALDSVCPGGTTTLNSNTSSTNFTIVSDSYSPIPLTSYTSLVENAVSLVPLNTGSLDDGLWQNIPIGFTFNFLGNNYTTCAISTNGNVQFGPTFSTGYTPVFGTTTPNNFAALFWTDLNFSNGGGNSIRYQTSGTAPNRVFSVFMNGTRFADSGKRLRGQIEFQETTGIIEVNILQADAGTTPGATNVTVVGAENIDGTINAFAAGRNTNTWSGGPEGWKFNPPVNYGFVWSPSGQISGSTTTSTVTAAPTANTTYQLIATDLNTGCDNSVNQQAFVTVNVASAPPVANFFADDTTPSTGGVLQTVTFTTTTDEFGPTTYAWTFVPNTVTYVNGTSATSRNPQVQFEEPGQYTVTMAMTSCTGTGTRVRNNYINAEATYCQPIFGTGDGFTGCNTGYGLGNVIILNPGGVTIMNHTGTGCASPNSALGYADYSVGPVNGTTTCTMYQGTTYTINTTSLNPANNQFFAAYLDVDGDGDFNDPLEFLGFNTTASATATFSLGVPTSNVTYGLKKMRVIGAFGAGILDANDACLVTTYGEAHDYVVNIQPPIVLNDIPAFATNVIYSSNQVYPGYTTQTASTASATNSPESTLSVAADIWYRFVAVGQGVSIEMSSSTMDDQISLYSKDLAGNYILISNENASSGTSDFERLNVGGLTPGTQYWVSFGAAVAGQTGAFTFSISHLTKSGCSYAVPAAGFPLCNTFKGIYRGTLPAVSYSFTFTPTGATAGTATTVVGTGSGNNLIALSNPTLALRYGGTYTARVDVTYTLFPSTGAADVILVSGSTTDANCSGISIITQPNVEVRSTQRCPAALLRSTYLAGTPVVAGAVLCGATSYTYEFTQVAGGCGGTATGLPLTYNTIANSPYLQLSVLPLLANPGAWDVKIRPNFVYGAGQYGPTQRILVNGTSASTMLNEEVAEQDVKVESFIAANLYPNPNNGEMVNLNVSGIESDNVFVRITDAMGRIVYTNRFAVEGSLNQIVTFAEPLASGIYNVEFTVDGEIMTERMIVAKQ